MAADQLLGDAVGHCVEVEVALLAPDAGMEDHLEEQVAELLAQMRGVTLVDGFSYLVGFFQDEGPQALAGLLTVPGAAALIAQTVADVEQPLHGCRAVGHLSSGVVAGDLIRLGRDVKDHAGHRWRVAAPVC